MTASAISNDWTSLFEVWHEFTADNPQLAISGQTVKACNRFARAYQESLIDCGALAKTSHGRWLAHRAFFPVAAFAVWIGHDPQAALAEYRDASALIGRQAAAATLSH